MCVWKNHDGEWNQTNNLKKRENNIYKDNQSETGQAFLTNKGNNKITELRTILQRESQNS
jgi:hypothetical protein